MPAPSLSARPQRACAHACRQQRTRRHCTPVYAVGAGPSDAPEPIPAQIMRVRPRHGPGARPALPANPRLPAETPDSLQGHAELRARSSSGSVRVPAVHHVRLSALTAPDHSRSSGARSDCPRRSGWLHGVRTDCGRIAQLALQHRGVKQRIVIGERPTARESSMAPLGGAAARSARRALAQTCGTNTLEACGPAKIGFFGIAHFRTSRSQDLTRIWGLIWGDRK